MRGRTCRVPVRRSPGRGWAAFLACALLLAGAQPASAVIILVKNQDQPLRGYLIRESDEVVVFDQLLDDGQQRRRTIAKSDIEDLIVSVSEVRLQGLDPANPPAYREYAEELAEKRRDPDAQRTAIRLFLIAAYLDTSRLGRSCLLGMAGLARDEVERRRFLAMAYLLDPKHDASLLRSQPVEPPPQREVESNVADGMLRALRLLRQGNKRDALTQARRARLKERLADVTDTITYDEFEEACAPQCPHCKRGQVTCPECQGKKMVLRSEGRIPCPVCRTSGQVTCPHCAGSYQDHAPSADLLRRILLLEMQFLPVGDPATVNVRRQPAGESWTQSIEHGHTAPVRALTLETITEFDPRRASYRDGEWSE